MSLPQLMGLPTNNHGSTIDAVAIVGRTINSSIGANPESEDKDVFEDENDSHDAMREIGGNVGDGRVERHLGDGDAQLLLRLPFSSVPTVR
jgi:hypothetical protein